MRHRLSRRGVTCEAPSKSGLFGSGCFPLWVQAVSVWKVKARLTLFGDKKKKGKDRARTSGLKCSFGHEEAPAGQETPRPLGVPPSHGRHWALAPALAPWPRTSLTAACLSFPPLQSEDQPRGTSLLGLWRTVSEIIHGKG